LKTLLCTVGLPRSGKTTWARAFSQQHACPIVNPDSIRLAMHGQRFAPQAERFVWATAHAMVGALFLAGHDHVIVDATNTTRKRRDEWMSKEWRTAFVVIAADEATCIERAAGDEEIIPVIRRMASQWEPLGPDENAVIHLGSLGTFSDGVYAPHGDVEADQGDLRLAIAADKKAGLLRVEFGKPVAWLALPKKNAEEFIEKLRFQIQKL
jgi:predicted kinase